MMTNEAAIQALARLQVGMQHPYLPAFIHWKYRDEPVLTRGGQRYATAAFAVPPLMADDLEAILGPLTAAIPTDDLVGDPTYRDLLAAAGRPPFDGATYTLRTLTANDNTLRIDCALGGYFAMLDTCDALEWEALSQAESLTGETEADFQRFDALLTQRQRLHELVAHPVRDGSHRSVGMAVSVSIAYRHRGKLSLLMRKRSAGVAVHPNLVHVVPSFMLGPTTPHIQDEYAIRHHIFREYLEELFDRPEASHDEANWHYFYDDPRLLALQGWLRSGAARLSLTGVSMDLLNLRADVCAILVCDSEEWYERHMAPDAAPHDAVIYNQEYNNQDASEQDAYPETIIPYDPTVSDAEMLARYPVLSPHRMTPTAAGAFWLGVDQLRQMGIE